jgi:light-harvesting complex II chlorophyll a/b binding protein 7
MMWPYPFRLAHLSSFLSDALQVLQQAQRRKARRRQLAARCELSWESAKDVGGLVLFSALPFVAVQALADSRLGKDLLAGLEARKPLLEQAARQREAERQAARQQRWAPCLAVVPSRCSSIITATPWHVSVQPLVWA